MAERTESDAFGNIDDAFRWAVAKATVGGEHIREQGLDRVRTVRMRQEELALLVAHLLARATATGASVLVQAEMRDNIPVPLTDELRPQRCVMLSTEDDGPPLQASEIARAMWYGLAQRDPGDNRLAWIYYLVRGAGGKVSVERGPGGSNRVSCYLPTAPES